jgi:hypothetical protein
MIRQVTQLEPPTLDMPRAMLVSASRGSKSNRKLGFLEFSVTNRTVTNTTVNWKIENCKIENVNQWNRFTSLLRPPEPQQSKTLDFKY